MKVSIDFSIYHEHKIFFDEMAVGMQSVGHQIGFVSGMREHERVRINREAGFKPDFVTLWGEEETIANGNLWKCKRLDELDVLVHFDPDASELKKYTGRWIIKVLNSGQPAKF